MRRGLSRGTLMQTPIANADVYRNLLKHCVSIRIGSKVAGYVQNVIVRDVVFRVRPAGVQRIRARGQREVIAYARGTVVSVEDGSAIPAEAVPVHFNPFLHETFVLEDGTPVHSADALYMTSPCGSYVVNPK